MLKKIKFTFSQIKYKGKSIGDDIRVEIELLNKILRVDKKIKINKTTKIDKEIGNFIADQKIFIAKAKITIIEKDVLFNDVANIENVIKIDVNNAKPQKFVYEIELKETRSVFGKFWGKSIAIFEITIEANVLDLIKYIPDVDNGWLYVKIKNGKTVSLPAYLKVRVDYVRGGREYLTMLEGAYRGQTSSVKLQDDSESFLLTDIQHKPMIRLRYSILQKILILGSNKYRADGHPDSPWEKGLYDIEVPDYPHSGGSRYEDEAKRAKTWFRIGHKGERYLHTGRVSLGCITITDVKRWDEIYDKLIKARKGDSISVGTLEVVD